MDIDRLAAGGVRVIDAQALPGIATAQRLEQSRPRRIHGDRLEPALGGQRIDQHEFRRIVLGQPRRDRFGDAPRREILAFGINEAAGALDQR